MDTTLNPLSELDLFQCLEHAHIQFKFWHHETTSYAEHNATGGFYDSLADMSDALIETYIGCYGRTNEDFGMKFRAYTEGCTTKYLEFFMEKMKNHQEEIKESAINNMIDEIVALAKKTKYLLTLK
jgi:hypothetical protein